jgi:CheY-like chemotaxis protein
MNTAATILAGAYDYRLVALSVVIAISASYAALDLAGRVPAARGWTRGVWLGGGAVQYTLLKHEAESVRALTRNLLEQGGYTVLEADNGAHAVEIAKKHHGPIHLLLTDVVMPGMQGPALTDKILPIHSETKVLYVSGYSSSFGTQTGLIPAGANLLQKPFSREALLRKLRNLLDVQKESRQPSGPAFRRSTSAPPPLACPQKIQAVLPNLPDLLQIEMERD